MAFFDTLKDIGSGLVSGAKNVFSQPFGTSVANVISDFRGPHATVLGPAASAKVDPVTGVLTPTSPGTSTFVPPGTTIQDIEAGKKFPPGGAVKGASTRRTSRARNARPAGPPPGFFFDPEGKLKPDPQAASGTAGTPSPQSFNFGGGQTTPATSGLPGVSGRSAFSGLLGAVGLGGPSIAQAEGSGSDQDEQIRRILRGGGTSADPVAQARKLRAALIDAGMDISGFEQVQGPAQPLPVDGGVTTSATDLGVGLSEDVAKAQQLGLPDIAAELKRIQGLAEEFFGQAQATKPPEPVRDTEAQQEFLNALPDVERVDVASRIDQARREIGLTQLESNRIDLLDNIRATNQAFRKITDEINTNPDLPKGLAQRRVKEFDRINKNRLTGLIDTLNIVSQQIADANNALNLEFRIIDREASDAERRLEANRNLILDLIEIGAVDQFEDDDEFLKILARKTNLPKSAIRKLIDQAQVERQDKEDKPLTIEQLKRFPGSVVGTRLSDVEGLVPIFTSDSGKKTFQFNKDLQTADGVRTVRFLVDENLNIIKQVEIGEPGGGFTNPWPQSS